RRGMRPPAPRGAVLGLRALRTSCAAEADGGAAPPPPPAAAAPSPAGQGPASAAAAPVAAAPPATRAPAAAPAPPPAPPPRPSTPFRLALTYTHVLHEGGDLANDALSTDALGLLFVSPSSSYVR